MASLLARSRGVWQALAFARQPQAGPFSGALRFISATPIASDDEKSPSDSKSSAAASAVVDPDKDAAPKEVLAIPVPKPLIPGAPPIIPAQVPA